MVEKKATVKKATTTKTTTAKRTAVKKTVEVALNAESVGFRAGDVYQALAAAAKPLSVAEIAKTAKISTEDTYLGIGWLLKEGKVKGEGSLVALA